MDTLKTKVNAFETLQHLQVIKQSIQHKHKIYPIVRLKACTHDLINYQIVTEIIYKNDSNFAECFLR